MNIASDMTWLGKSQPARNCAGNALERGARQAVLCLARPFIKRTIDILLSLLLGAVFLPVILVTALLVRLDSPGPVFYSQKRIGKDGRKITIHKFRSMHVNAEDILSAYLEWHPAARQEWEQSQKLRVDPRITRVGKWMREFSVDEIPQLYDILKGDMSLVGPRPILLEQAVLYGEGLKLYHSVRPGLTGFWQVSGRNLTTFHQRTLYDIHYVRNWSIWLDLHILFRTVWIVLKREGAY